MSDVKMNKCQSCEYTTAKINTLHQHILKHHRKDKIVKCQDCDYSSDKKGIDSHKITWDRQKNHKCKEKNCNEVLETKHALLKHYKEIHKRKCFCKHCQQIVLHTTDHRCGPKTLKKQEKKRTELANKHLLTNEGTQLATQTHTQEDEENGEKIEDNKEEDEENGEKIEDNKENDESIVSEPVKIKPKNIWDKTNKYCDVCDITLETRILFLVHCSSVHDVKFKFKFNETRNEIERLKEKNKEQEDEIEKLKEKNKEQEDKIKELEETGDKEEERLELGFNIAEQVEQIQKLNVKIQEQDKEIKETKADLEKEKKRRRKLHAELKTEKKKSEELKANEKKMRKKLEAALDTERRKLNKTTNELCQARTSLDIAKKAGEKKDQDQERSRKKLQADLSLATEQKNFERIAQKETKKKLEAEKESRKILEDQLKAEKCKRSFIESNSILLQSRVDSLTADNKELLNDIKKKKMEMEKMILIPEDFIKKILPFAPNDWLEKIAHKLEDQKNQKSLTVSSPWLPISTSFPREWLQEAASEWRDKQSQSTPVNARISPGHLNGSDLIRLFAHEGGSLGNWLNDNIINEYLSLIVKRSEENKSLPSVTALQTYFWKKLQENEFDYASVKRICFKRISNSHQLIFIPINKHKAHWSIVCIDRMNKSILLYDSMFATDKKIIDQVKSFLQSDYEAKFNETLDINQWTIEDNRNTPKQENSNDCGVFVLMYAEFLSRGKDREMVTIEQEHCRYYRAKICYELVQNKILNIQRMNYSKSPQGLHLF